MSALLVLENRLGETGGDVSRKERLIGAGGRLKGTERGKEKQRLFCRIDAITVPSAQYL